jgi:hypothetical protein
MQEAKDGATYDPRRQDHKTGKDGKFIKVKKGTVKPKNALTVTYLCFAFDVPYATFKRWKNDAFVTQNHVPEHKFSMHGECLSIIQWPFGLQSTLPKSMIRRPKRYLLLTVCVHVWPCVIKLCLPPTTVTGKEDGIQRKMEHPKC